MIVPKLVAAIAGKDTKVEKVNKSSGISVCHRKLVQFAGKPGKLVLFKVLLSVTFKTKHPLIMNYSTRWR